MSYDNDDIKITTILTKNQHQHIHESINQHQAQACIIIHRHLYKRTTMHRAIPCIIIHLHLATHVNMIHYVPSRINMSIDVLSFMNMHKHIMHEHASSNIIIHHDASSCFLMFPHT